MWRKEDLPKRLRIAVVMLIVLLLVSLQQQAIRGFFSEKLNKGVTQKQQLSFKQGSDSLSNYGIVHDDSQPTIAQFLNITLLLGQFPIIKGLNFTSATPPILSRNFCCIVPKGP